MMRSLYSGVSGLKTHQTKMDVIGNNIANVNTVSYKSQSITFSELMYQTTQSASGPNAATGTAGQNARQIGLGVATGAISAAITTPGATQTTGGAFDLKITGESFFIVNNGGGNRFTRDGSFFVDAAGNLAMASTGYNVMGWGVDEATQTIKQDTVAPLRIMSAENMTYPPESTTKAYVSGILDKNDSNAAASGKTVSLQFYDNLGYLYTAKFNITEGTGEGNYEVALSDIIDSTGVSLADTDGDGEVSAAEQTAFDTELAGIMADQNLAYDPDKGTFNGIGTGTPTADDKVITLNLAAYGGKFSDIEVDWSRTNMYDNNGTSTIGAKNGDTDGLGSGRKLGNMSSLSVQEDGMIYASYDNGQTRLLGQIAVAKFANASGLQKDGDNLYSATLNSGEFDGIGVNISSDGTGYMTSGVLEMSNVDLSSEFTEMITTQRGFQANSRIITVSDTMIEELVNLKR